MVKKFTESDMAALLSSPWGPRPAAWQHNANGDHLDDADHHQHKHKHVCKNVKNLKVERGEEVFSSFRVGLYIFLWILLLRSISWLYLVLSQYLRLALRFMQEMPKLYRHRRKPGLVLKEGISKTSLQFIFKLDWHFAARNTFTALWVDPSMWSSWLLKKPWPC